MIFCVCFNYVQESLANTIFTMESDFTEKLKQLQSESEKMEKDIVECKEQKNQLLEDILESERQVMLWEKKILLEKETQEALDPEYGQAEVAGM
jgi:septal ring factor EnvC (AmiA/AmiB activator)